MDYFQVIILSLVEGFTEFLPVSSTGHLILASKILNIPQTDFVKSFEIIIQLGAVSAVVFLYWHSISKSINIWKKIITAFIPTAIVGFIFYNIIKNILIGNEIITIISLFIGGIIIILFEKNHKEKDESLSKIDDISYKNAFIIGLFQSIAVIPGVSRAGATILPALFLGAKRKIAVEFSFLLAIPTMLGASVFDIAKSEFSFNSYEYSVLALGFIFSFFFAVIAIKFFLKFIQTHNFIPFGIYRIILSIIFALFLLQ